MENDTSQPVFHLVKQSGQSVCKVYHWMWHIMLWIRGLFIAIHISNVNNLKNWPTVMIALQLNTYKELLLMRCITSLISTSRDTEQETLAILATMGSLPSPSAGIQSRRLHSRSFTVFRSAGRAIIAIHR